MWWIFFCVYYITMFLIFQYPQLSPPPHASLCLCMVCSREHQAVAIDFNLPTPTRAALLTKTPSVAGVSCRWAKAVPSISSPPWDVHSDIGDLCVTLYTSSFLMPVQGRTESLMSLAQLQQDMHSSWSSLGNWSLEQYKVVGKRRVQPTSPMTYWPGR